MSMPMSTARAELAVETSQSRGALSKGGTMTLLHQYLPK